MIAFAHSARVAAHAGQSSLDCEYADVVGEHRATDLADDRVDAVPAGCRFYRAVPSRVAGVDNDNLVSAERAERIAFRRETRGRKHRIRAEVARNLDRRGADSRRSRGNHHALARLDRGGADDRVVRGHEDVGNHGGIGP